MPTTITHTLYHKIQGEGEPIILIGGLNVEHTFWTLVANNLSEHYKVIMPDNRGVGGSPLFEPECSTELMAQDIINLLDIQNIKKAHLMGHSLGGCIAQQVAIKYPDRVNKLILCSTQAVLTNLKRFQIQTILQMMQSNISREIIVKQALAGIYSNNFFNNPDAVEKAVNFSLSKPVEQSRKSYFYQVNALLNHDTSKKLNQIKSETLIIGGEEDVSVPVSQMNFLSNNILNAKLCLLPNMAHMLPIENSTELCQQVLTFLKKGTN
jgi:pimeloyl-ACP methyl ester carboxylesterase